MKGRWAQGLEPRAFCWVIKDRLAASERPGGYAGSHRKIRRQEELIWLGSHGFTHVLSVLESPHNLSAYDDAGIAYEHVPLGRHDEMPERLTDIYKQIAAWVDDPTERVLIHREEFGDLLSGILAGYLIYGGFVQDGAHAIEIIERITGRQLGPPGREIVAATLAEGLVRTPATPTPA